MAKVIKPLFQKGIGCLRLKPQKNLKSGYTHVVSISKRKKRKAVNKNGG